MGSVLSDHFVATRPRKGGRNVPVWTEMQGSFCIHASTPMVTIFLHGVIAPKRVASVALCER